MRLDSPVAGADQITVGSLKRHRSGVAAEQPDDSDEASDVGNWFHLTN